MPTSHHSSKRTRDLPIGFPSPTTTRTMRSTSLILFSAFIANSTSFTLPSPHVHSLHRQSTINILNIRGGDLNVMTPSTKLLSTLAPISEALVSGSPLRAVGALYVVASLTVVPLTLIRQAYSFSVGVLSSITHLSFPCHSTSYSLIFIPTVEYTTNCRLWTLCGYNVHGSLVCIYIS
jgi:hypothetical protein